MKALKRIGSFLLALVMVLSMIPATHTHAAEVTSGYCGDPNTNGGKDVSWTFQDGVLTISGTGKTNEYGYMGEMYGVPYGHDHLSTPWTETAVTSLVVEEGVTHILGLLSWGAYNLTDVSLPDSLKVIGHCSFEDCDSLTSITIPKNVTSIWSGAFWACENLTSITFTGDAPSINDYAFNNAVTATCYYPASANWPADKLKSYGGNLTWVAYDVCADGHSFGTDDVCTGCGILGGSCGSNMIWTLDDEGNLVITGTGSIQDYDYRSSPFYKYADRITSVSLPDGLTSIGERAFDATFPNLDHIEIPTSVTHIQECAFGAYYDRVKLKYPGTMAQWEDLYIAAISSYGKQYGAECSDGTIIYMGPCSGSNGLYDSVKYMLLGDGTLKITGSGAMTFYRYLNYESCFSSDDKITKVVIDEGVTSIAGYAFKNCENLTEVYIPASVTSISYNVFQGCTALTDVYYGSNEKNWNKMSISSDSNEPLAAATIHYTDLCTGGHSWTPANCTVPKTCSVCDATEGESLGHTWVDANCTAPKTCSVCDATEGEAIPTAHTWVEANCTYAKTCDLCGETEGEAIPNAHVFEDSVCKHCGLQGGTCGESAYWTLKDGLLTVYGSGDMTSAPWPKEDITTAIIEEGITSICESAFEDCEKLTSVTIPDTVATLGSSCFYGCKSLASVDLPEGITAIPYEAFAYCWALTGIEIPQSVTTIGGKAFYYSREIVGMQIPEKVTSIGADAFTGCSKLKFVRFNGNAPTLGNYAFRSLTLTAFYPGYDTTWTSDVRKPYGGTVTWVAYDQTHTEHSFDANGLCSCGCIGGTSGQNAQWALDPVTGTMTISGTGKMEDYASASQTPWTAYKDIVRKVVVEEGITHVGGCAFKEFSNLETVSLPDSLTSIGSEAIMLCKKLTEIEIPSGVTQIGTYAFEQCYALESVVLPNGLSAINDGLFNSCTGLKTVTIPASVTTIGTSAFSGCNSLTDVYYGSNEKAWGNVTIGSYNTPLLNATIHYTDPCLQGHSEVCGVCTNCGIGLNLQDYQYTLDEAAATVTLANYIGSGTDVHVAASYLLDGKEYSTLLEATSVFRGNTAITSVAIDDGVTTASNSMAEMFYGCASLKTADLAGLDTAGVTSLRRLFSECKKLVSVDVTGWDTSKVEDMSYLFDYCSALTTITGYENWNTGSVWNINKAFNRTTSIHKVDLSKWDLSKITNSGWCFQICYAEEILLPDNLAVMSAGFFNHPAKFAGSTFTIPSGVKKIGYAHTIYDFGTDAFAEFIVPETNSNYQAVDGILYSKDGTELIAVPRGKPFENGIFEVPNTVTFMGELSFSRNYNIETLVLPDEFIIEYVPLYDSRYILEDGHGGNDTGNLNSGTNLSIAIYCYTGITAYDVRDTNTHYEAVDGVIYSEDMTTMVAVPARYAQHLNIPEGVTSWNKEALWADHAGNSNLLSLLENCTGVSIPSTLTEIDAEQLSMINNLADRTSSAFTITVAEGNRTFHVDPATGHLATHSYSQVVTDPTCEDEGYTTHTCAACGDSYETDPVPAKDHDWTAATCIAPKTCTECGETEGEAASDAHSFADGACSVCGILGGQCGDEAYWILSDGKLTVYGSGNMYDYQGVQVPWGSRRAIITQVEVMGGVTSVGDYAFNSCTGLTVVTLADSVVEVGQDAFAFCSNLQMLDLGNGLESFDYYAFRNCTSLKELTIPGSIRNCGESAFQDCTALESVTFDDGAAAVGMYMFQGCTALKSVTLPDSITYLADAAFRNCGSLEGITIPAGVKNIGVYAFENCTSLETVQLQEGLERIGGYAFYGCEKLQGVQLPTSVERIDESAFAFCTALTALELPQGLGFIGFNAFDRSGLASITVPGTVTELYGGTFYGCEDLAVAVLEEGVTTLHSGVFRSCTGLQTLVLPKTITQMHDGVLEDTNVTDLYYGSSLDAFAPLLSKVSAQYIHYNCTQPEGHWSEVTRPGSCTQDGYTCDSCPCGYERNIRNVQTAPGHDWLDADCETAKTCKVCGETEGEALGHNWVDATCVAPKTCSVCGETEGDVDPTVHAFTNSICTGCGAIQISATTFPDANFRSYIMSQTYGADNVLTQEELQNVTSIDVGGKNISDLTGIGYFTALENLVCYYNQLTSLDVSGCTALKTLYCSSNQLTSLNVSGCAALESLDCDYNQLTSLNVSGCAALESLECDYNQLTSLDVSGLLALKDLNCDYNRLTSLDASGCTALKDLRCYSNQLTSLDVSGCTALEDLDCSNNKLTSLDVSGLLALKELDCNSNQLTSLDVGGLTALRWLRCSQNKLTSLDVSGCTALESLDCCSNQLTSLDVSKNTALRWLSCYRNQLTSLDVSGCTALRRLTCYENQLTGLDVSGLTALEELYCYSNQLTSLEMSGCTALEDLECYSNQLTRLDVSGLTALYYLNCASNQLTSLDVSKNAELVNLYFPSNKRTVSVTRNQFDLSSLSADGFDISKARKWQGGTVSGNILTVTAEKVTYTYDIGGLILDATFVLVIDGFCSHNWTDADCENPKTCTLCGATEGESLGHDWLDADCETAKTCKVCGATEGAPLDHNWTPADCENPKTCTRCGETEGAPLNHNWLDATCSAPKTCSVCGETEGEANPNAHSFADGACVHCGAQHGYCGDPTVNSGKNVSWTLVDGKLIISGTGAMADYDYGSVFTRNPSPWYSLSSQVETVVVENGVTTIGDSAFWDCNNLTLVTIPDSVTTIGEGAFTSCNNLTSVIIPNSVTTIGRCAFSSCENLTSVTIPDSVTTIDDGAFAGCAGLMDINIPDSVTTIGNDVFLECTGLNGIWVEESNPNYSSDSTGTLFNKDKTQLIRVPGNYTGDYTIPNSVTTIAEAAFSSCYGLTSVTIPNSVTIIADRMFRACENLTSVTISDTVTSVGERAFEYCDNLADVYYGGTEHQWQQITINNGGNDALTNARIHYTDSCADGHSWTGPTCYAPKTCSVCGAIDSVAWGHDWANADCNTPETCKNCGTTRGEPLNHEWADATCTSPKTCSVCGETEGEALGHSWVDADCVNPKTCKVCGETQGEALGHDWQDANCTTSKTCTVCGKTEGEALGHTVVTDKAVEATCTETGLTEGKHCSVCGEVLVAQQTVPAKQHTWKNATCDTPKTCNLCGKTQGKALGHDWQAADCTNPKHCKNCSATEGETLGHTWLAADCDTPKTCSVCGVTEGTATGHTWKNATCVAPKTCDLCGKTQGDAKGHDWSPATCTENATCKQCGKVSYGTKLPHTEVTDPAVNATCTTTGKTEGSHCSVCGTVTKAQQTIPALDHMEVIDKAVEATCTATGKTEGSHCSVCGKILKAQDKIPAMGHTPVADAPVAPTCAKAGLTEGAHCVVCGAVLKAQQVVSTIAHTYDSGVDGTCNVCGVHRENVETRKVVHMFRMYNPNTGEHFYTGSEVERDNLIAVGWQYEGIGFTFPANTGLPVYRLFQPSTGEHLYTMDEAEKNTLMAEGWNYEGIAFNSAYDTEAVQHRLHNPNATVGAYHFTFSEEEKQNLINAGWEYQGIGWYSCWK